MDKNESRQSSQLAKSGIEGLDDVLNGGFTPNRLYSIDVRRKHKHAAFARRWAAHIVIDSLNGYLNSMPADRFLTVQLHELLNRLGQLDVATLLIGVQHGLIGSNMSSPVDASYLADTVLLLRYFEMRGEIRQALSVMKKRGGAHERTIREFRLDGQGVRIGSPLHEFRGVLTGVPVYEGKEVPAMKQSRKK